MLLDPRDGSGDLIGYFPPGFAETAFLNSADVMSTGNGPDGPILWGVEIKKLSTGDVIDSLQSGRLVEQLGKMQEDYDWRFLLIEGAFQQSETNGNLQKLVTKGSYTFWSDVKFGNKQRMSYGHFWSWLLSVMISTGTFYLHTNGRQETADTIVSLAREFDKPWEERGSVKTFHIHQPPGLVVPTTTMLVIKDLAEGVGWEKAIAAANHFKTVKAAVNATEEEWCEVRGINKTLAKRLVEGANEPHVEKRRKRRQ